MTIHVSVISIIDVGHRSEESQRGEADGEPRNGSDSPIDPKADEGKDHSRKRKLVTSTTLVIVLRPLAIFGHVPRLLPRVRRPVDPGFRTESGGSGVGRNDTDGQRSNQHHQSTWNVTGATGSNRSPFTDSSVKWRFGPEIRILRARWLASATVGILTEVDRVDHGVVGVGLPLMIRRPVRHDGRRLGI